MSEDNICRGQTHTSAEQCRACVHGSARDLHTHTIDSKNTPGSS